eukprot:CAMPEP_0204270908 /NCGR_PEP_ID=MMETSP0468-20130131/19160_1 /ASSEMBLY_ACC=CAM_ASM_000383 /TAXON_ID=2969 /ORGANISM="Oxyrrhis marina" /LENGTH=477 /DNA_ID=CAMNT_0051246499 /DNA_START=60 /DNA_END=1494 /DNA_ORIENTATION=+
MPEQKKRVLVIGGGFSGLLVARDLHHDFDVLVVDAKEYFEYTPGILRAYVKPAHFDALTFTVQEVIERKLHSKFLWGEVKSLDGNNKTATVKPIFSKSEETINFDYCVICAGCNFNPMHKWGQSLWFATIHEAARPEGDWPHIDERFLEGRRRHILEENQFIAGLNAKSASVLVVGAGFIGVEWATELQYFFPNLRLTIIDFLNKCLGPLPDTAASYCNGYMKRVGINCVYGVKYNPKDPAFWGTVGMDGEPDHTYVCIGVKASNYFMEQTGAECLSDKGPGGGKWIHVNKKLQVVTKDRKIWADGSIFAVGDCNQTFADEIKPIPKISYPGEEQATHVCKSIKFMEGKTGCCGMFMKPKEAIDSWWPWGAGMFATSLGPHDACFVMAAKSEPRTGLLTLWGWASAIQKEIIESSKVDECKGGRMGQLIWHWVTTPPATAGATAAPATAALPAPGPSGAATGSAADAAKSAGFCRPH